MSSVWVNVSKHHVNAFCFRGDDDSVAPLIRATVILIYSMLVMQVSLLFSSLEIQNVDMTRENTLICYYPPVYSSLRYI